MENLKELRGTPCYSVVKQHNTKLKLFNHEQRNLEQDPEHFNYRSHRHRNHLRGDFLHGRVN